MAVVDQEEQQFAREAMHALYSAGSLLDALTWLDRVVHRGEAVARRPGVDTTTGAARLEFFWSLQLTSKVVSVGKTQDGDFVLSVPEGEALDWWSHLNWYQARIDWARSRLKLISHSEAITVEGANDTRTPTIELILPFSAKVLDLFDGEDRLLTGRHEVIDQRAPRYRLRYDEAGHIPVVDVTAGSRQAKLAR